MSSTSSSLLCHESFEILDDSDDNMLDGGIRSFEDPMLIRDSRVLDNIFHAASENALGHISDNNNQIDDYFVTTQKEIKPHMRRIVVEWMLDVTEEQQCQSDVFGLAVSYLDKVLSRLSVSKNQLQLLACVCMFIASKVKESEPLCADKLVVYTDFSITTEDITKWELLVLEILQWDLSAITAQCVVDHLLRRLDICFFPDPCNKVTVRRHAETFVALLSIEYPLLTSTASSSLVAMASIVSAVGGLLCQSHEGDLNGQYHYSRLISTLANLSGISTEEIIRCSEQIEQTVSQKLPGPMVSQHPSGNPGRTSVTSKTLSSSSSGSNSSRTPTSSPTDLMDVSSYL